MDVSLFQISLQLAFPGLLGIHFIEITSERVVASIEARPDLSNAADILHGGAMCTPFHRGRTTMVWQTLVKFERGKRCAVATQTQMVIPANSVPA